MAIHALLCVVLGAVAQRRQTQPRGRASAAPAADVFSGAMTTDSWSALIAAASELGLALWVLWRGGGRSPTVPLVLLSLDLFLANFASFAELQSGTSWLWLYQSAAPMVPPLVLHLVLSFTGQRRRRSRLVTSAYAVFGAFAVFSLVGRWFDPWTEYFDGPGWPLTFLIGVLPIMVIGCAGLVRHLIRSDSAAERERTRLMLLAIGVFIVFAPTELLADMVLPVPRLGSLGTLIFNALLVLVAVRLHLFEHEARSRVIAVTVVMAVIAVVGYLAVFRYLAKNQAMMALGTVSLTAALLLAARRLFMRMGARREQLSGFARLGRLSTQMAHDLKNPLAALKGAVQFLQTERQQGRSIDGCGEYLQLMGDQVDRMTRVVEVYQRLGRIEPLRAPQDLNRVVEGVLGLQRFATRSPVEVASALEGRLPMVPLDSDLVARALENLLQNAFEAMDAPNGGRVVVRTSLVDTEDAVVLSVEDNGSGMDPRTAERAFDEFFTSKPHGTGLGLSFVRRVVEAHGGEVHLATRESLGTVVSLRFPLR